MAGTAKSGLMISGELAGTHPAKLIFTLFKGKKTGTLRFDDGVTKVKMSFKDGCLVAHLASIPKDKNLARYIVRTKKVTNDEMRAAWKIAKDRGVNFLEELVRRSILSRADIDLLTTEYYWKTITGAFSWRHGTFQFEERGLDDFDGTADPKATIRMIVDGIKTKYSPEWVSHRLQKRMAQPLRSFPDSPVRFEDLELSDGERKFGEALLAGTTLRDAIASSDESPTDLAMLAFALLALELVKFKGSAKKKKKKAAGAKGPSSALERAMAEAEASVEKIREKVLTEPEPEPAPQPYAAPAAAIQPTIEAPDFDAETLAPEMDEPAEELDPTIAELPTEELEVVDDGDTFDFGDFGEGDTEEESLGDLGEEPGTLGEDPLGSAELDDLGEYGVDLDLGEVSEEEQGEYGDLERPDLTDSEDVSELVFDPEESPDQIYKIGLAYVEQGAHAFAQKALYEAQSRGLNTPELRCNLGWAIYCVNEEGKGFDRGADMIQGAIKEDPGDFFGYLILGRVYKSENDLPMAELYFVKALELNRDCDEAKSNIRDLYDAR
jgi:tetratricopeptide (TPR) repeat protein